MKGVEFHFFFIFWKRLNGGTVPPFKMHPGGTVPPFKMHPGGTVPPNKMHPGGTVPPNKMHPGGTVPPNKMHLRGTIPLYSQLTEGKQFQIYCLLIAEVEFNVVDVKIFCQCPSPTEALSEVCFRNKKLCI